MHKLILLITILLVSFSIKAQENSMANCSDLLNSGYVSDGKEYKAKLDQNNKVKFYATFFGDSQYRIIACSDITDYKLQLSVYDTEKNLLYSNINYNYSTYWNFTFNSTIDCIIEIGINSKKQEHNEVMLLIGFKEK